MNKEVCIVSSARIIMNGLSSFCVHFYGSMSISDITIAKGRLSQGFQPNRFIHHVDASPGERASGGGWWCNKEVSTVSSASGTNVGYGRSGSRGSVYLWRCGEEELI